MRIWGFSQRPLQSHPTQTVSPRALLLSLPRGLAASGGGSGQVQVAWKWELPGKCAGPRFQKQEAEEWGFIVRQNW